MHTGTIGLMHMGLAGSAQQYLRSTPWTLSLNSGRLLSGSPKNDH
jgi:hypothetical protein